MMSAHVYCHLSRCSTFALAINDAHRHEHFFIDECFIAADVDL
jgi:hypothetical protein